MTMWRCASALLVSFLFSVAYAALPLPRYDAIRTVTDRSISTLNVFKYLDLHRSKTSAPYIKPCSFKDPNLNDCARLSAIAAIPEFVKGDPKYKVPRLEPLVIESMMIQQGTGSVGLTLNSRNCLLHGLKNVDIQVVRIDPIKHHVEYDWFFPKLTMNCDYNVKGKILLLPIQGDGKSTYVLSNMIGNYTYDYDLVKKEDNLEYAVPRDPYFAMKTEQLKIKLENLFNGNKFLGDNMNTILNDNWEELMKDMGPAFGKALGDFINQCLKNVFDLVPYKVATLDSL